ncbi:hypothetical protein JXL21_04370 [Candidatus Bathyarchaeota archaeon]|nr:hypothetical protein [Candidatus Bathyarchaeota archaeon]
MGSESAEAEGTGRRNPFERIDPIQLMIWGVLLVAYGLYSAYGAVNSEMEGGLMFILVPYLAITFFGATISIYGYRKEKEKKKEKDEP